MMPLVYGELKRIARRYMRSEDPGHTLQATALVNDAYVRLIDQKRVNWQNRAHFFGAAAQIIRHLLVDHARARRRLKRGGEALRITLTVDIGAAAPAQLDLIVLDDALRRLEAFDPEGSRIVELRFFGGLSIEETAEALGVSPATIKREWSVARAWLHREITSS
jgi:RNA polymerase sigma factor (TIGR02999 family)